MYFNPRLTKLLIVVLMFMTASVSAGEKLKEGEKEKVESKESSAFEFIVTDYFNEALSGVRIENPETGEVFISDFDGKVSIPVQEKAQFELSISHLGFDDCKFNVNTQSRVNKQVKLLIRSF